MTFFIKHTDTTSAVNITDGSLDNSTSLTLVGKNYPTYGEIFNQNFVSLLENFAYVNPPANPMQGQIWYDTSSLSLNVYRQTVNTSYWQPLSHLLQSDMAPVNANNGDMWWDTANKQLKIRYNTTWVTIGPQTTNDGFIRVTGRNSLTFSIGTNDVWTIDKHGYMLVPYTPTVQGWYRYNSIPSQEYYDGEGLDTFAGYVPVNVSVNVGTVGENTNVFDPATGIFTVPVAGIYHVTGWMNTGGGASAGNDQHIIRFAHNQNESGITASNIHTNDLNQNLSCTGYIQCAVNDTLQFEYSASAGATINDKYSGFSIRLVG
jgi:hypothetical protein